MISPSAQWGAWYEVMKWQGEHENEVRGEMVEHTAQILLLLAEMLLECERERERERHSLKLL